jgi:hypothetical protein
MAAASRNSAPERPLSARSVFFRYVTEDDARRILELRRKASDEGLLSATRGDEDAQRAWLRDYARRHAEGLEHYFMVCGLDGAAIGTMRVHDVARDSCWWGSWVLAPGGPVAATLESYVLVNFFMFEHLELKEARFRVRAVNHAVVRFHDAMRSPRVGPIDADLEYRVDARWYAALKQKHAAHFSMIRVER